MTRIERFAKMEAASQRACDLVKETAREAIVSKGRFSLAISGGSTPRLFFRLLSQTKGIDWEKTHVFLVDERLVPVKSPDSNLGQAKELLLEQVPIPQAHICAPLPELPADDSAREYEKQIRAVFSPDFPDLDVVHLGMGSDGHTASLFPGSSSLEDNTNLVTEVTAKDISPPIRVSMTLPLINSARLAFFLIQGKGKATLMKEINSGRSDLPAARVSPQEELYWLLAL